jgi:hypothetical protein
MRELGLDEAQAASTVTAVKWATTHQRWFATEEVDGLRAGPVLRRLLRDQEVQQFLQVNRYQDILWFSKEAFARLLWWLELLAAVAASADPGRPMWEVPAWVEPAHQVVETLRQAAKESANQVETLLEALGT